MRDRFASHHVTRRSRRWAVAAAAVAAAAVLAACGKADDDEAAGGGGVKTGPGVSADTIRLGLLSDLSGPFAAGLRPQVQTMRLYWRQVNDAGGVCERKVELEVQDHGYDPQKAVSLYRSMEPNIAALQQLQGSPMIAALLPTVERDSMYSGGMGWASVVLPSEVSQMPGASYSVATANAVDFLVEEKGLSDGDAIGQLYFEGDYGEDALAGAEFAAERNGLRIVKQQITPADTDMSSQASAFRRAGVDAMIVSTAPGQLASIVGVANSIGLDVPIVANMPAWNPSVLKTTAGEALAEDVYAVNPVAPYAADAEPVRRAVELYEADQPKGIKDWGVTLGWGQALLMHETLKAACEAEDLSREGIVKAMRTLSGVETNGLFPEALTFDELGEPPSRTVFVTQVDPDAPGGLRVIDTLESESAKAYEFEAR
jgi:ABC-type branched-subunit amino acid transport system substrate-binding protein